MRARHRAESVLADEVGIGSPDVTHAAVVRPMAALAGSDSGSRQRTLIGLQRSAGNRAVQRLEDSYKPESPKPIDVQFSGPVGTVAAYDAGWHLEDVEGDRYETATFKAKTAAAQGLFDAFLDDRIFPRVTLHFGQNKVVMSKVRLTEALNDKEGWSRIALKGNVKRKKKH